MVWPCKYIAGSRQDSRNEVEVEEAPVVYVLTEVNVPVILAHYHQRQAEQHPRQVARQNDLVFVVLEPAVYPHIDEQLYHNVEAVAKQHRSVGYVAEQQPVNGRLEQTLARFVRHAIAGNELSKRQYNLYDMPDELHDQYDLSSLPLLGLYQPELVFLDFKRIELVGALEMDHLLDHVPLKGLETYGGHEENASHRVESVHGNLVFVFPLVSEAKLDD